MKPMIELYDDYDAVYYAVDPLAVLSVGYNDEGEIDLDMEDITLTVSPCSNDLESILDEINEARENEE